MFDIGWGELLVIGVVALIAIGPKELPGVLRTTGMWMGKIRRMASEFQDQFREAMREAEVEKEMEELKKKVDDISSAPSSFTDFDPLGDVRKDVENLTSDQPTKPAVSDPPPATEHTTAPTGTPTEPKIEPAERPKAGEGA
jgi:sec-independent protein translocase protein TatB